jgi:hypothetical protein
VVRARGGKGGGGEKEHRDCLAGRLILVVLLAASERAGERRPRAHFSTLVSKAYPDQHHNIRNVNRQAPKSSEIDRNA